MLVGERIPVSLRAVLEVAIGDIDDIVGVVVFSIDFMTV